MEEKQMDKDRLAVVLVIWRNMQMKVEINSNSSVKELGMKLVKLCNVNPDTMKLLVPLSTKKRSKVVIPFSDEFSNLTLEEAAIPEGKPIRMMGVLEDELGDISQNSKPDLRIIGFEEEEKRLQQRKVAGPQHSLKLPEGDYIFCSFRTLEIPGIQLNPPPSEALRRMHMLACDPGIIAIMKKHRWQVGIMTEMAPEGYVGISPKCLLGFNKNHGEEISLRLRTDDLKGFRKYESIKKTLLHELAHMVHSEHDANFFVLNKQLNQEVESLDWTKSKSHTLSGRKTYNYENEVDAQSSYGSIGKKLGGSRTSVSSSTARASSVAAAYERHLALTSTSSMEAKMDIESKTKDDDVYVSGVRKLSTSVEPDPDDKIVKIEPDPDDTVDGKIDYIETKNYASEPDPDDASLQNEALEICDHVEPSNETMSFLKEPDTDSSLICEARLSCKEPDPDEYEPEKTSEAIKNEMQVDNPSLVKLISEPYLNDDMDSSRNRELQRMEASVDDVCKKLQKAIETLRFEATPVEATSSLQTLLKIIKNVIEHPNNLKFRRLCKGNHSFQRNVSNHKAAMEILAVAGFREDAGIDEYGRSETYVVLKRNDPGLLWLAKSALESVA